MIDGIPRSDPLRPPARPISTSALSTRRWRSSRRRRVSWQPRRISPRSAATWCWPPPPRPARALAALSTSAAPWGAPHSRWRASMARSSASTSAKPSSTVRGRGRGRGAAGRTLARRARHGGGMTAAVLAVARAAALATGCARCRACRSPRRPTSTKRRGSRQCTQRHGARRLLPLPARPSGGNPAPRRSHARARAARPSPPSDPAAANSVKAARATTYDLKVEGDITERVTATLDPAIDTARCTFLQVRAGSDGAGPARQRPLGSFSAGTAGAPAAS